MAQPLAFEPQPLNVAVKAARELTSVGFWSVQAS